MFDYEKFNEWEDAKHIPQSVKKIVNAVCKECNLCTPFEDDEEETITLRNRGGWTYGYGKGFTLSYRTSSIEDGPDADPKYIIKFIKGLGFEIENSHGDNGMDSATNWHDTWWTYEFLYKQSVVYSEVFED